MGITHGAKVYATLAVISNCQEICDCVIESNIFATKEVVTVADYSFTYDYIQ